MKPCICCGRIKPIDDFYRHPMMSDGHLNKCVACVKMHTKQRIDRLKLNAEWVLKEALRCRIKSRNRRALMPKPTPEENLKRNSLKSALRIFRKKATTKVSNAIRDKRLHRRPCAKCGNLSVEAHHEDYSKPLEVVWLCKKHHMERHVEINDAKRIAKILALK